MAKSPHILGTTTQLSRARSTTEIIARRAVRASHWGPTMPKARETPSLSNIFSLPCHHTRGTWGRKKGDPINLFRPRIINSTVESHLDVVEVISSSLIIHKPDVSFSILTCSLAMIMDKRLVGLTLGGRDDYIFGSELQANMKRMDTSYALE